LSEGEGGICQDRKHGRQRPLKVLHEEVTDTLVERDRSKTKLKEKRCMAEVANVIEGGKCQVVLEQWREISEMITIIDCRIVKSQKDIRCDRFCFTSSKLLQDMTKFVYVNEPLDTPALRQCVEHYQIF